MERHRKRVISLLDRLMLLGGLVFKMRMSGRPDDGRDNFFAPMPEATYTVRGDFGGLTLPGNGYARTFKFHPKRQRLAVAGILLALAALMRRGGRRG